MSATSIPHSSPNETSSQASQPMPGENKSNFIKNRWEKLSESHKKAFKIGSILTVIVIAAIGLIIAFHFGLGKAVKDFMNTKFVPFFQNYVGPALKSSVLKVAHFMNLQVLGLPLWGLMTGVGVLTAESIPAVYVWYKNIKGQSIF